MVFGVFVPVSGKGFWQPWASIVAISFANNDDEPTDFLYQSLKNLSFG